MVIIVIMCLIAGIICGKWCFSPQIINFVEDNSTIVLYILMFSVGVSVGCNKGVLKKIKEYHIKIFVIPVGIIAGSLIGGAVCSEILNMPVNYGLSVASGLGWYSLSGVLITDLIGAQMGALAFLSNLMREILSFMTIPFLSRKFNYYTAIAPAAATSEDTTLSMLIKYTSEEIVVLAVFNGIICSAVVPFLIKIFA